MAKKKEILTLDEVRRCVKLYQSFHATKKVNIETAAKELGVKKLDLWEFILENKEYFVLKYIVNQQSGLSNKISYRYIRDVLENPMSQEEYIEMKRKADFSEFRD